MSEYDKYNDTEKKDWNVIGGICGLTEKQMQYLWTMIIVYAESHGAVVPLGFEVMKLDDEEDN